MSRVNLNKDTRELREDLVPEEEWEPWFPDLRDLDSNCPDPLVQLCKQYPLWGTIDSFVSKNMGICMPMTIVLAFIVGIILKWLGVLSLIIGAG